MKKWFAVILLVAWNFLPLSGKSQSFEAQQLLLNVEKLAKLKEILHGLKKGHDILSAGYTTIKNLSEGSFRLHKAFLDGLLQVSPSVRRYKRVVDILDNQKQLLREYRDALRKFRETGNFTPGELEYLGKIYSGVFNRSMKNLDALTLILTNGVLRMSDEERLKAIDRIFAEAEQQLVFLRQFNSETLILSLQRSKEKADLATLKFLYGVPK